MNELSSEENAGTLDTESSVVIRLDSSICCVSVCVSGVPSVSHCGPLPDTELILSSSVEPVPCTRPRSIGSWL